MPRLLLPLALLGLFPACNSAPPVLRPIPESQHGSFRFIDRIDEASPPLLMEGEFTVESDTITVNITTGICLPAIPPSTQYFNFRCGQALISFDRRNPLQRAFYTMEGTAMVVRRVCVRYVTQPNGTQACAQFGQERVQERMRFEGRIRPIPLP